jgi:NADP-dependent 3-hydroxy acid dehydrogenase YdfG
MKVQNKVIVVTGGGNGIGRAVVLMLLERGAKVVALDLNEDALKETLSLAKTFEDHLDLVKINITDRKAVEELPSKILKRFNQVDGLINVAGIIQPFIRVNELDYERIERVMNVNFYGSLYMIKTFLPHFLERPEAHIVNISSMGGFVPVPGQTIYGASKAAIKLLSEGLRSELIDTKVGISVVFPGGVSTNITGNSGVDVSKLANMDTSKAKTLTPREAANFIVDAMENNTYQVYAGKDSSMLNLIYRLNPKKAADLIGKQLKALLD